jgi:hypothetical protein
MTRRHRKNELEWQSLEGALDTIGDRTARLRSTLPPALLVIDHQKWDPSPSAQALDRPSHPRLREAGQVDDSDGIDRPTETAALRLLNGHDKSDRSYRMIVQAVRAVWLAADALRMAENKLATVDDQASKADEPRIADVCLRCQRPGAGLESGYCPECFAEWQQGGFPDHELFTRSFAQVEEG